MKLSLFQSFARFCLVLAILPVLWVGGCSEFKEAEDSVEVFSNEADRGLKQLEPSTKVAQPLTIDKRPYFGASAVPIKNGRPLPAQYEQNGSVIMTFARPVTLSEFARMLQAVTGLRTIAPIAATTASVSDAEGSSGPTFTPSDGERVSGGRVVWQGRLSSLLNQAADVLGAEWTYDGDALRFETKITRTFMLHSLAAELSMSGSIKSGGTSDTLPSVDISSTANMQVWSDIEKAVNTILGDGGQAAFSPSTGTITVTGTPNLVRQVEAYLNQQNSMRLRRVAVALKVITVTTRDALTLTGSLKGIIERAFDTSSLRTLGDATSGLAIGVLKAPEGPSETNTTSGGLLNEIEEDRLLSELRALKEVENAAISHSGALVTLSDQPAPLQVGREVHYLASTSSTTGDSGGSTSLNPDTVNLGLMMTVLPRIVEQNRILMRVSIAITDAQRPFQTFTAGGSSVQLPEVSTTGFLQNAVLTSGETMVLAGFEKDESALTTEGSPVVPFLSGGQQASNKLREVTIMMISAEILPEDPVSVIGR